MGTTEVDDVAKWRFGPITSLRPLPSSIAGHGVSLDNWVLESLHCLTITASTLLNVQRVRGIMRSAKFQFPSQAAFGYWCADTEPRVAVANVRLERKNRHALQVYAALHRLTKTPSFRGERVGFDQLLPE